MTGELAIDVFRGDDFLPDGEIPLLPVLRAVFVEMIGPDAKDAAFGLAFYELPDRAGDDGKPPLVNLRPSHGFVRVEVRGDGGLLYREAHPVRELIAEPLRELLSARDPGVAQWGYALRGPGLEGAALTRPAPEVTHEFPVEPAPGGRPAFTVHDAPGPELPRASLAALGARDRVGGGALPRVAAVIPAGLVTSLTRAGAFSEEVEEGGFLAGTVYRDAGRADAYLLRVTAVIPAERTGASAIGVTFTGESFLRAAERLAASGETLLGWYHTHLFPAASEPGLSAVDVGLHRSTFRRPWQVAALVTITAEGRELTMYCAGDAGDMPPAPYFPVRGPGVS